MKSLALLAILMTGQFANPNPMDTAVRLHLDGSYGSGTVIYSDDSSAVILSCAHIFRGSKGDAISVESWEGGGFKATGHPFAIDVDHDLSLIAINVNRKLSASRVVPRNWRPARSMKMYQVGCAEGDRPSWFQTKIRATDVSDIQGKPGYRATECDRAPKQGRSGGGLFTTDFYVAGVCNFQSSFDGGTGLYASPDKIRDLLDSQNLSAAYAYPTPTALVETQQQVRGLFAGLVGRRGAIGFYAGPKPGASCGPRGCPAPSPAPTTPIPTPPSSSSSSSSSVVEIPVAPVPAAPDLSALTAEIAALKTQVAQLQAQAEKGITLVNTNPDGKTSQTKVPLGGTFVLEPIHFVTPQPDGTEARKDVGLGGTVKFKIPKK